MIHLLITSGRGPAECRLAVARVVELITAEAEAQGLDMAVVEGPPHPEGHGPGSVVVAVDGAGEAALCRSWVGTIQRRVASSVRPGHKRKNWFVSVSELSQLPPPGEIDVRDVRFEAFRAGGPGGQHQNVTDSAVRATHVPSGLTAVARDGRSQHQNKATALARLRQLVEIKADIGRGALRDEAQRRHNGLERGNPVRVI